MSRQPVLQNELLRRVLLGQLTVTLAILGWLLLCWRLFASKLELGDACVLALGPALLSAMGAWRLVRQVRPLGVIIQQLRAVPATAARGEAVRLQTVTETDPVSLGWNRLAAEWAAERSPAELESHLDRALETLGGSQAIEFLHSLPEGIALSDDQGKFTFSNKAFLRLATKGGSVEEPTASLATRLEELLDPEQTPDVAPLLDPQAQQKSVIAEITRDYQGDQRVLRLARHPVRGSSGVQGQLWSLRDVSQQKLAEKMRDEFLDSATHELRTPLANILAYAETLALSDMLEVEQQKEFCNTINSEATRLARLIDDLLSISSMEVGSLSISRQQVDVARLIKEVINHIRPTMDAENLVLQTVISEKLPEMKLDKDKISSVLVNLLGNAAKYTPAGGNVSLKARFEDRKLILEVEDTGLGISEEDLPKVFDKFFRSTDERVQQITGTGLGLALANELVRLHGGQITVESQLNEGTRFTVILPA